jgi:hypothetical protein
MKFITAVGLEAARAELSQKSCEQIEAERAAKWACLAIAAFETFARSGEERHHASFVTYAHEAIEHAAEAGPGMADVMRNELDAYRWAIPR